MDLRRQGGGRGAGIDLCQKGFVAVLNPKSRWVHMAFDGTMP